MILWELLPILKVLELSYSKDQRGSSKYFSHNALWKRSFKTILYCFLLGDKATTMTDVENVQIESKLQVAIEQLSFLYPNGVSHLIIGYLVDKVMITAEYYCAAFEGRLSLMQYIDKEYSHLVSSINVSRNRESRATFNLIIDALELKQMEVAKYLRQRLAKEDPKGKVWEPRHNMFSDEERLRFIMDIARRDQLYYDFDRALECGNTTFVKLFLQRFPDHRFSGEEEESCKLPPVRSLNPAVAYKILRYDDRKNTEEKSCKLPPMNSLNAAVAYMILRYGDKKSTEESVKNEFSKGVNSVYSSVCIFVYNTITDYHFCNSCGFILPCTISTCDKCQQKNFYVGGKECIRNNCY